MATLPDHIVAVCEKYYAHLDIDVKTKELTDLNLEGLVAESTKLRSMYEGSNSLLG